MKKLLSALIAFLFLFPLVGRGDSAEDLPIEPYNVFIGIEWGDDMQAVTTLFGHASVHKLLEVTYLDYRNVAFGDLQAYSCTFYFYEDKLTTIAFMFMLPEDTLYPSMCEAFTQELGEPASVGDYEMVWLLPDETEVTVSTDLHGNSVNLKFANASVLATDS